MIINVRLDRIEKNPWQTREGDPDPEYIKELALDIEKNGLMQVPVGRFIGGEGIERSDAAWKVGFESDPNLIIQLAFGHNRLAAYIYLANSHPGGSMNSPWKEMPVDIRTLDDKQMALMAWSENEKRKDVTPIERAKAIERRMADFGWNQHEVADQLGVARPTVANILRLLKLPQHMQDALQDGRISARVGSALLPMYELPTALIGLANAGWVSRPRQIETDALAGNSSDKIRKDVEQLYLHYTKKLQGAEFGLDELFTEGLTVGGYDFDGDQCKVYCGLCRTCDRRLKDQGNVCMDPDCFTAKTTLHRRKYLAAASGACGIEVVDPNKGIKGLELQARQGAPSKAVDQAVQAEKEADPDYEGDDVDVEYEGDNPEEDLVRMIDEEKEAEVRAQTEPKGLSPKELEEAARQARKEKADVSRRYGEAREKVIKVLVDALRHDEPGAFYLLASGSYIYDRSELDIDKLYKRLAQVMAEKVVISTANNVDELYEIINRKLSGLGLDAVYPYQTLIEQFEEVEYLTKKKETHENEANH